MHTTTAQTLNEPNKTKRHILQFSRCDVGIFEAIYICNAHEIAYIINEIVKLGKKQAIKKKLEDMKSTKNNRKKKQMSKLGIDNNIVDPAKVVRMCCSVLQCVALRCND